jgi:hypothetical protein
MTDLCPICDGNLSTIGRLRYCCCDGFTHCYEFGELEDYYRYGPSMEDGYRVRFYRNLGRVEMGFGSKMQYAFDIADIDFDPKHPEKLIAQIKMLETFSV